MNNYFKARKRYLRNVVLGIGVCLYLYVFQVDIACRIFRDTVWVAFLWPLCMLGLYGIFAWIRSKGGKEWAYTGKLRIIPKLFVGYMLLSALPLLGEIVDFF